MRFKVRYLQSLLLFFFFSSCAVLPKTLNENNIIVIANYKWIGKIGNMTISEGPAIPILKNINTGKIFRPDYHNKSYTYFYRIDKGIYKVDEILLDAGRVILHIRTADRTRPFEINESGAFFIGGLDIVDSQFRIKFNLHDSIQEKQDLEIIKNLLSLKTSFSIDSQVERIENVLIKEKWVINE